MNAHILDTVAVRTAKSLSRRASLIALGGASVTAFVRPMSANAGKVGKKVKKTCKRQIGQCQSSVAAFCTEGIEGCEESLAPCCAAFKNCKAGAVYECIVDALLVLDSSQPT